MRVGVAFNVIKRAGSELNQDNGLELAAALSFYTALSFGPLLMLLLWFSAALGTDTQQKVVQELYESAGSAVGQVAQLVLDNAERRPDLGRIAGLISIGALLLSATSVFAALQTSMNTIWDVKARPAGVVWAWLRKRLLGLGMLLLLAVLLLAAVIGSAVLSFLAAAASDALPGTAAVWRVANQVITLAVTSVLFAAMFRYLPDVEIAWSTVWFGAILTAVLFAVGQFLTGLYLGHSSVGSPYGAAGSLIVLLVWVYYTWVIVFFGAEVTQVWARRRGWQLVPDRHAEWADRKPRPDGTPGDAQPQPG